MGCINGKSPLTEEDMNYIARNTAMEKDAVEVSEESVSLLQRKHIICS